MNLLRELVNAAGGIADVRPWFHHAIASAAGNDVDMQVVDGLAGSGAIVAEDVIAFGGRRLLDGGGEPGQHFGDLGQHLRVSLINALNMRFGDDQRVAFGRRIDVQKRNQMFVFKELGARDLPRNNPAKNAFRMAFKLVHRLTDFNHE